MQERERQRQFEREERERQERMEEKERQERLERKKMRKLELLQVKLGSDGKFEPQFQQADVKNFLYFEKVAGNL